MEDLIGVGVADTTDQARIGERALQRVILCAERVAERGCMRIENLDASRIDRFEHAGSTQDVDGRPVPLARLCHGERAGREIQSCEVLPPGELHLWRPPMQPAGDHQVDHEPEITFEADRDPLADAPQGADSPAVYGVDGRVRSPKYKGAGDPHALNGLPENSLFECADISGDVR